LPETANLKAAKIEAAPDNSIKSWKPPPGAQFEVAGRPAPVIRPEKPTAGKPGRG